MLIGARVSLKVAVEPAAVRLAEAGKYELDREAVRPRKALADFSVVCGGVRHRAVPGYRRTHGGCAIAGRLRGSSGFDRNCNIGGGVWFSSLVVVSGFFSDAGCAFRAKAQEEIFLVYHPLFGDLGTGVHLAFREY